VYAKNRLLDTALLTLAIVGPLFYLLGYATQGLGLFAMATIRVVVLFLLLMGSAGLAAYLALRPGDRVLRLVSGIALIANLGGLLWGGTAWNREMQRAQADAALAPIPRGQVGILLAPRDETAAAAAELRAVEARVLEIMRRNGIESDVTIRRVYPLEGVDRAERLAFALGAHVVVWQRIEDGLPLRVGRYVTVLGAPRASVRLEPLELLNLMATQERFALLTAHSPEDVGVSPLATEVVSPIAAGYAALAAGRPVLAATMFRNAAGAQDLPIETQALLHSYRGLALALADRPDLAISELEASRALAETAHGWAALGNLYLSQWEWEAAADAYTRSISRDPYYALPYCGLGLKLARERDVSGALAAYQQAVALEPHWPAPYALLGQAFELLGDAEQASAMYETALAKAGPHGLLQEAAARQAAAVRANPPTPIPTATLRPTPTATPFPSSGVYVVQRGDTLASIARAEKVPLEVLIRANQIENPNTLSIGQVLFIPDVD
jgi:tetratricopeptide (TPR) repeat protein